MSSWQNLKQRPKSNDFVFVEVAPGKFILKSIGFIIAVTDFSKEKRNTKVEW